MVKALLVGYDGPDTGVVSISIAQWCEEILISKLPSRLLQSLLYPEGHVGYCWVGSVRERDSESKKSSV